MSRAVQRTGATRDQGLAVRALSHGFVETDVLHDISLTLSSGETLAIIGPSGTGKSTLLRLLAFFDRPDRGEIQLDGIDVWARSQPERLRARRQVGMVFQTPNLFETSVRRNVEYGRHIRREWNDRLRAWADRLLHGDMESAVQHALETVHLADAADQDASSLSGGEAQRVAFARALACDPDYLLLDEPTSDLDPRNTAVIEEAIEDARRDGRGIAMATHDMHQAERVADRVGVMLDGRIIEIGPTDTIFSDPTDDRVRQFIEGELVY